MKRLICIIMIVAIVLMMSGCGKEVYVPGESEEYYVHEGVEVDISIYQKYCDDFNYNRVEESKHFRYKKISFYSMETGTPVRITEPHLSYIQYRDGDYVKYWKADVYDNGEWKCDYTKMSEHDVQDDEWTYIISKETSQNTGVEFALSHDNNTRDGKLNEYIDEIMIAQPTLLYFTFGDDYRTVELNENGVVTQVETKRKPDDESLPLIYSKETQDMFGEVEIDETNYPVWERT